jgi:malignant T-cell-amplified sequence
MFKKEYVRSEFDSLYPSLTKHSITAGQKSKVKSSVQRAIRTKVVETYPLLAPYIDEILPKKEQLDLIKL